MTEMFQTPLKSIRIPTREVSVGKVKVGGNNPIRIQSMLTCETTDVQAVLKEMQQLDEAGCEIIRLTVPNMKAVEAMPAIRSGMRDRGIDRPLVADIHFSPQVAYNICEFVEKVRINPGNFADRKKFQQREYSQSEYQEELQRVEHALLPLIERLKRHGCSLRIGSNHGSLADRLINRYGDTPLGMVESALEYVRLCRKHDYNEIIISMKSSIPSVMLQAYRLLVLKMRAEGFDYPLHLGVTEAGSGLDGRIKSAVGIGGLLADGIGDTIRVSLTEPARNEIPAANSILKATQELNQLSATWEDELFSVPLTSSRRDTTKILINKIEVGGLAPVKLLGLASLEEAFFNTTKFDGLISLRKLEQVQPGDVLVYTEFDHQFKPRSSHTGLLIDESLISRPGIMPLLDSLKHSAWNGLLLVNARNPLFPVRKLVNLLDQKQMKNPLGLMMPVMEEMGQADTWSSSSVEIGALIVDGLLDTVVCPSNDVRTLTFELASNLLQATRARLFKADFISCPSCGRTYFDLQQTTERIMQRTKHLKGVKIGIMGCVVNGPGEMADADFGYVGVGENKISLYRGQECVQRSIPTHLAVDKLIELIKQHGQWVDP